MSEYLVPAVILATAFYAALKGTDVFAAFVRGAGKGLQTASGIFPSILAMLTAVNMLRASGVIDWLTAAAAPLTGFFGIPAECTPLMLLKPLSGGGALAIGADVMKQAGVDTLAGRTAAVMLASADTTFFVISVYFGALGIKKARHTAISAVAADLVAFIAAAWAVKIKFG